MRSTRPESSMPLRMHLMVLIGFLALVGAMAMLVNGSSLRTGFVSSGSVVPLDDGSSDSIVSLVHLGVGKSKSAMYDSAVLKHASIAGPDQTRLVLKEFVHQSDPFYSDVSVYWGGRWAHVRAGTNKTEYRDLHYNIHVTHGDRATEIVNAEDHVKTGPNATAYDPSRGGTLIHLTQGDRATKFVFPNFHIANGENATSFDATGSGELVHITYGQQKTTYVYPQNHQSGGVDKTGYVVTSQPTPVPAPTPPTQ